MWPGRTVTPFPRLTRGRTYQGRAPLTWLRPVEQQAESEHGIGCEQRPRRQVDGAQALIRVPVKLVLHLRDGERGEHETGRDVAFTASHEGYEQDEPDEELGREHLAEHGECGHARGERSDEPLVTLRPA